MCELKGKADAKKGSPKKGSLLLRWKKVISDRPDAEGLESLPLIMVNGLLVWRCKGQTVNTSTRNRRFLPLARRRKGVAGFTGLCGFEGLVYQTTEV